MSRGVGVVGVVRQLTVEPASRLLDSPTYLFRDTGNDYAGTMIDLKDASRDELIRLVVAQHETIQRQERIIARQQEQIAALEATVAQLTVRVDTLLATVEAVRRGDDETGSGRP